MNVLWLKICITSSMLFLTLKIFIDKYSEYKDGDFKKLLAIFGVLLGILSYISAFLAMWWPE